MQQKMEWTIKIYKLEFIGLFDGCCGAVAPSAPPLGELAKIFDF